MWALKANTTANYNTAIGYSALNDANRTADTDGYNVALGYNAGNTNTNDITTGNKNTLLGSSTAASAAAGTNQSVVGYGASGQADNSVTLGNADVTAVYMSQDKGATVFAAALGFGSTAMTLPYSRWISESGIEDRRWWCAFVDDPGQRRSICNKRSIRCPH